MTKKFFILSAFLAAICAAAAILPVQAASSDEVNLLVLKRSNGAGTVVGVDKDGKEVINCGATCSVDLAEGTIVNLTATAKDGSVFKGWSDGCDNSNDDTLSTATTTIFGLTLNQAKIIYAKFQLTSIPAAPVVAAADHNVPRVAFWPGKVNQHWNLETKAWETDPDGVSGSRENKLEYCQKFYPTTVKVIEYKTETANAWRDRGNLGQYLGTRMSYRCVLATDSVSGTDVSDKAETPDKGSICYYYPNAYLCRPFNNSDNLSDAAKAKVKAVAGTVTATSSVAASKVLAAIKTATSSQLVLTLQDKISALTKRVLELEDQLTKVDTKFAAKSAGTMFLDVENNGRLWYVDPVSKNRFYFENGEMALTIGSKLALGVSAENLKKIPVGVPEKLYNLKDTDGDGLADRLEAAIGSDATKSDTDGDGRSDKDELASGYDPSSAAQYTYDEALIKRLEGKLVLQAGGTGAHGEIWYIQNGKRWYGGTEDSMYEIMKAKSLGATAEDIRKITVGEVEN